MPGVVGGVRSVGSFMPRFTEYLSLIPTVLVGVGSHNPCWLLVTTGVLGVGGAIAAVAVVKLGDRFNWKRASEVRSK